MWVCGVGWCDGGNEYIYIYIRLYIYIYIFFFLLYTNVGLKLCWRCSHPAPKKSASVI